MGFNQVSLVVIATLLQYFTSIVDLFTTCFFLDNHTTCFEPGKTQTICG